MTTELDELRAKTDVELAKYIGGWKVGTEKHVLGMMELKRRQERSNAIRGWIAILIAVVAGLLSIVAILIAK